MGPTADGTVDVHQRLSRGYEAARAIIDSLNAIDEHSRSWEKVSPLLREWVRPGSLLGRQVLEIWLEHDSGETNLSPRLFLGFEKGLGLNDYGRLIRNLVASILGRDAMLALTPGLDQCLSACGPAQYPAYLGLAPDGRIEDIRLNIKGLALDGVFEYLAAAGWEGDYKALENIDGLLSLAGNVILCLDIGRKIRPRLGFECSFPDGRGMENGWEAFLNDLIDRGLCTSNQRDAFLAWPGKIVPEVDSEDWPEGLIIESLLTETKRCSFFNLDVSHLKLTLDPGPNSSAKAYLWFDHRWGRRT